MSITSIKDKVSARVAAGAVGVAMIVSLGFGVATQAYAAGLTSTQVQSILSLLQSFGADQATINNVQAALNGQPTSGTGTTSTGSTSGSSLACYSWTNDLTIGSTGPGVTALQQLLNSNASTQVAASGPGSPGMESTYFGKLTQMALAKWQAANGVTPAAGYFGPKTRAAIAAMCSGGVSTGTGTGTVTSTGPGITVSAATQPANTLAPALANRVPFTTFTLTNNTSAPVTINDITVQRSGLAADAAFAGVELIDQNGVQIGTSRTFDSTHQAQIGTPFTLNAGQSETYTVAANMQTQSIENSYAGEVATMEVVAVDTSVPVSGSLPITGAMQTINSSLTIGTASTQVSSYDPNSSRSESIGTTGLVFSGVRITAGSAEDEKLMSITWNQTGSVGSTDLSNLVTEVNGTSYPLTVDSSGKYFTSTFPGGIALSEGQSVDVYIQGDITGSDAAGRTVEFDVYRPSDIYLVGQTYGYGITPVATGNETATLLNGASSGFYEPGYPTTDTPGTPFFEGSQVSVTAGTLSTISNAGTVGSQNIAINTPNQSLGGFTTDFTGEPVTVQSLSFNVSSTTSGTGYLTNVSVVDQNGNVIAGPVNESSVASGGEGLVFNSSVTFPVGAMTYTLEGTVPSTASEGTTYQLSTNPDTEWSGAQGETSGSSVSLPNTTISMSTMTVQGGTLNVSAAATPASTTIAPGASNMTIADINLDASQSGEDVRISSLPIVVNASTTAATTNALNQLATYLTNCQLYNGSTALNNQSIGSTGWTAESGGLLKANFVFQSALTIPKGTVTTLDLECNVSSSIPSTESFSAGVNSSYAPSPTGVQSGDSITADTLTSASGTMTPGTATLAAALDSSAPSYTLAAGGTTGVTVGAFNLTPSSDAVNLQKIGLKLSGATASSSDVMSAMIYNGSTEVGSLIFTNNPISGNYYATTSVTDLNLPQNVQTILTIKADLSSVGPGQAGKDGHIVTISLADAQGVGASSGTTVNSGRSSAGSGVGLFRSFPTLAAVSSNSATLVAATGQTLYEFSITPSTSGEGISLAQVGVDVATSSYSSTNGSTDVQNLKLYGFTDDAFSQPISNSTDGLIGEIAGGFTSGIKKVTMNELSSGSSLQLSAGTTYYFKVLGDIAQSGNSGTAEGSVTTYVAGDGSQLTSYPFLATGSTEEGNSSFVWSPNSTTSPTSVGSRDWTNGYGLPGLPSTGMPATTLSNI